jgi:hypothetical protein
MWVAIHKCLEATLGISLHSYLYLKLKKTLCLSYFLLCFLFNKIGEQEVEQFWLELVGRRNREGAQTICTHVSKCKNNKIKERKK